MQLRGYLSRWLIEADGGVYIGRVSASVRDLLWNAALRQGTPGKVLQAWSTANEQGFALRLHGYAERRLVDVNGILLMEKLKRMTIEKE